MDEGPKLVVVMSDAEFEDFVGEMRAAVYEEQGLHEVASGAKDWLSTGTVVSRPVAANRLLTIAGALAHRRTAGAVQLGCRWLARTDLPNVDAAALLADPTRWSPPTSAGVVVALVLTERGHSIPPEDWRREAAAIDW